MGPVIYLVLVGGGLVADGRLAHHHAGQEPGGACVDHPRVGRFRARGHSRKVTLAPLPINAATAVTSQFVRRTQPCDEVCPTVAGSGVP